MSAFSATSPLLPSRAHGYQLWYWFRGPRALRWQGRLDAWCGLPMVPLETEGPVMTGQLVALESAARHDFHIEKERRDLEIAKLSEREQELEHKIVAIGVQLQEVREAEREDLRPQQPSPEFRRTGESSLDITVVQSRRRREWAQEATERQVQLRVLETRLAAAESELEAIPHEIAQRRAGCLDRCAMIDQRAMEYMGYYWRALARNHPDRDRLSLLASPLPTPLSSWLAEQEGEA